MKPTLAFAVGILIAGVASAQPVISAGGIVNGASFASGQGVAPGSIVSIFGTGFASKIAPADTVPLTSSLGGVSVTFNKEPMPLFFVSAGQINAQVPWNIPANGPQSVVVTNGSVASAPVMATVIPSAPGIFTLNSGTGPAIVQNNSDGTFAWAPGTVPALMTHPAKIGDFIIIYANSMGAVDRAVVDGSRPPSGALSHTVTQPVILLGGVAVPAANVAFSGLNPNFVALYQINVQIPSGTPTGNQVSLQVQMGGITSTNKAFIAVSQ